MKTFPKKLFYKIGEVCDITQVAPHVIRYWETEFSALKPSKNSSGQRIYRYKDVDLILLIKRLLYEEGYTIAGANKKLQSDVVRKRDDRPAAEAPMAMEQAVAQKEVGKTDIAARSLDELKAGLAELDDASPDVISHLKSELQSILTLLERK
jgi:DNA-binding transcriptional MerR regulator